MSSDTPARSCHAHSFQSLPLHEDVHIQVLVSLTPSYPSSSPPQLQLLSKYIGAFGVDRELFGNVLKTFISQLSGVEFTPDTVAVFDGLQHVLEICSAWYSQRLSEETAGDLIREEEKNHRASGNSEVQQPSPIAEEPASTPVAIPEGVELIEADPITDRKSVFIGRACRITHPSQVAAFSVVCCRSAHGGAITGGVHIVTFDGGQADCPRSTPNNQRMAM
jgi:hypothetical protein